MRVALCVANNTVVAVCIGVDVTVGVNVGVMVGVGVNVGVMVGVEVVVAAEATAVAELSIEGVSVDATRVSCEDGGSDVGGCGAGVRPTATVTCAA